MFIKFIARHLVLKMESGPPLDNCDISPCDSQSETVDAKPSEVDAKPIIVLPGKGPGQPIDIPTDRDSTHYVLDGVKKVFIFNQKTFASRLQLNPRRGTDVDVKSIEATFKALDWNIEVHNDLTVAQIRDILLKQIQLRLVLPVGQGDSCQFVFSASVAGRPSPSSSSRTGRTTAPSSPRTTPSGWITTSWSTWLQTSARGWPGSRSWCLSRRVKARPRTRGVV